MVVTPLIRLHDMVKANEFYRSEYGPQSVDFMLLKGIILGGPDLIRESRNYNQKKQ